MAWKTYKIYNQFSYNHTLTTLFLKGEEKVVFVLSNRTGKYILWDGIYFMTFVNFSNYLQC